MNSHRQAVWELYQARKSGDPEHLEMAEGQVNRMIEAGEARRLFSVGCDAEQSDATDPVWNDIYQDIDRAARVEGMRELSGEDLHTLVADANEKVRQGGDQEVFNEAIRERNAAFVVMRERSQAERKRTKDMARTVGLFQPEGPKGYRAASAPDAELRATREEAIDDQVRWLDSPEHAAQDQERREARYSDLSLQPKAREHGGLGL